MERESFFNKKARILKRMALEELLKSVKDAKRFLENPNKIGDIDLKKLHELNEKS